MISSYIWLLFYTFPWVKLVVQRLNWVLFFCWWRVGFEIKAASRWNISSPSATTFAKGPHTSPWKQIFSDHCYHSKVCELSHLMCCKDAYCAKDSSDYSYPPIEITGITVLNLINDGNQLIQASIFLWFWRDGFTKSLKISSHDWY